MTDVAPENTTGSRYVHMRDADGRWRPGRSPNPGGRPKREAELRELAQEDCPRAIARLAELMESEDGATAIAACKSILDRGCGRPAQAIAVEHTSAPAPMLTIDTDDPVEAMRMYQQMINGR